MGVPAGYGRLQRTKFDNGSPEATQPDRLPGTSDLTAKFSEARSGIEDSDGWQDLDHLPKET